MTMLQMRGAQVLLMSQGVVAQHCWSKYVDMNSVISRVNQYSESC